MSGHDPEDVGLSGHAWEESAQIPALANRKSLKAKPHERTSALPAFECPISILPMPN
jgi:hypothetical protein